MKEWNKVLLIGAGEVKNVTIINSNVGDEYIGYAIRDTQNVDLQGIIGTSLLEKIKELVYNKIKGIENDIDDDLNIAYNDLLEEFIKPYLIHQSVVNILIPIAYKVRNMGVIKTSDNNIGNADMDEIKYLMQYYDNQASFFETRLSKYLCTHKDAYPELEMNDEAWMSKPLIGKNFATTDLWLGSDNEKTCGC
jgi:hypothetical protein